MVCRLLLFPKADVLTEQDRARLFNRAAATRPNFPVNTILLPLERTHQPPGSSGNSAAKPTASHSSPTKDGQHAENIEH